MITEIFLKVVMKYILNPERQVLEMYQFLGSRKPRVHQHACCSIVLEMDWGDGDVEGC